ncbi:NAD(P)/FAD-dependent oxidoreductase [Dietzia sp. B32]|uniref:NAD(P)/FAD-dependent oxidoreductase n=1 Tax=Dietzia sp. B32 TaxID=2915130 RepID=UPI0021AD74A6|nr:NAD(P)/FAD-dependent oxidoreductase [Dietzia sp. B32]UVE95096.1 NAD(P)/FAD-dependent oxidoreductase [Dietzia sp. B32]
MDTHDRELRDVVVVGGGAAGLGAALTLARARRRVTVVDAGEPRNAPAEGVHGLLALDGVGPVELLARGRAEVRGYDGEVIDGEVVDTRAAGHGFDVILRDGAVLPTRTLLIGTGVTDELPDVPGVREQWGHGVLHCPYCHGWEVRDQRIGILGTHPMSAHQAVLFHQWSRSITFFSGGRPIEEQDRLHLAALGIPIEERGLSRVEADGGRVVGVRVDDDEVIGLDAVVVATRITVRVEPYAAIGLVAVDHPVGTVIPTDEFGATPVPGVWAAGNCADPMAQVGGAAAQGTRAAQQINAALIMADLKKAIEVHDGARV